MGTKALGGQGTISFSSAATATRCSRAAVKRGAADLRRRSHLDPGVAAAEARSASRPAASSTTLLGEGGLFETDQRRAERDELEAHAVDRRAAQALAQEAAQRRTDG